MIFIKQIFKHNAFGIFWIFIVMIKWFWLLLLLLQVKVYGPNVLCLANLPMYEDCSYSEVDIVNMLRGFGVECGTDDVFVFIESRLVGLTPFVKLIHFDTIYIDVFPLTGLGLPGKCWKGWKLFLGPKKQASYSERTQITCLCIEKDGEELCGEFVLWMLSSSFSHFGFHWLSSVSYSS